MSETSMTLSVDAPRLLTQLPHFFQSLTSAMSEILQNSFRAHAIAVDIFLTKNAQDQWELTIIDDGPGAADPADLFTVARSGWEPGAYIEPAGLGLYALLGLSESFRIESVHATGRWTSTLTAAAFQGDAFTISSQSKEGRPTGLTLVATLDPQADVRPLLQLELNGRDCPAWRHAYPLSVTFHRRPTPSDPWQTAAIPSQLAALDNRLRLTTPVGTLIAGPDRHFDRKDYIVWEHRIIPVNLTALIQTLGTRGTPGKALIEALPQSLYWVVPAHTSLRPTLPERNAFIQDAAFTATIEELADVRPFRL